MIWLTWRQFRAQALVVAAAAVAMVTVLAATGARVARLGREPTTVYEQLTRADRNLFFAGIVIMAVAPAVIGAFWGATLVAKEVEAGTHRLAWNQSVTRTRWLATKLTVVVASVAAVVGVLTFAVTWWSEPLDGAQSQTHGNLPARLTPVSFAMRGIVPVGYAVLAVVLAVAIGAVLRRSVAAIALALAVVTFLQIAAALWVRPHLAPPVMRTVVLSLGTLDGIAVNGSGKVLHITARTNAPGAWVLSNRTVDAGGHAATIPSWFDTCLPPPGVGVVREEKSDLGSCLRRLTDEGYRQRVEYQPADRFWTLQLRETALLLLGSGLVTGFCFWWTRHRIS